MDRLISLEPSNLVAIRIEPGQKCYGELTLRNVMYTMPVAFRIQPMNKARYTVKPHDDSFLLHSIVVPGAAIKDAKSTFDAAPSDWFTTRKKQVFIDSGIKIMFVGSPVLVQLVLDGSMDEIREVLERSDPAWNPVGSVDSNGQTLLHIAIAQGRPDIVQLLLEFQPDVESQSLVPLLTPLQRTETQLCILQLKERRKDCARLLLANGAKPDIRNTRDGDTPLHMAAGLGDEQMVKLLLQKGANKDIQKQKWQNRV
ncbi:hypothetical protein Patl1_22814 [Pistacia atlantica]|uniref:Uncharacterized protein n=1 Tax=Pistacia atlantica TaxID=434234 RepID=A0ACC0ZWJ4_9ROSI|nr:hypothetical protein Patl1_22814 [Pistacia atlantica]